MPVARECSRRTLLGGALASAAFSSSSEAWAAASIVQRTAARIIVDNDFAGDPDGLVALAHQLLNAKTQVRLITSSALDPALSADLPKGQTATAGMEAVAQLLSMMRLSTSPIVLAGAETFGAVASPAAAAIVKEALREDALPMFLTCGGPLTNVAAALRLRPEIAKRMTLIWVGGGSYPDGEQEYNLTTDIAAARYVFEQSTLPVWQVTQSAYRQIQYSVAEMDAEFRRISAVTAWLYGRYTLLPAWVELGGSLTLGDSALVLLTGLSFESSRSRQIPARSILPNGRYGAELPGRSVRVFDTLDARLVLADMLSAFRLHACARSAC